MLCILRKQLWITYSSKGYCLLGHNMIHTYIHAYIYTGSGMQEKNALVPPLHHPLKMRTSIP